MKIALIGTGNVATVLGKLIQLSGHEVVMIYGRDSAKASALALALNTPYCTDTAGLVNTKADMVIFAVSDSAVEKMLSGIHFSEATILVHTAAAFPLEIFKHSAANYGVLYPLQSLRKETKHIPSIPFFIDANNETTLKTLQSFAQSLSPLVERAGDEARVKLHIAAVFVSNFVNFLYSAAEDFCEVNKLDFKSLLPLINETAARLSDHAPADVMTGPAARKDFGTIQLHKSLLHSTPQLLEVYEFLTEKIIHKTEDHSR